MEPTRQEKEKILQDVVEELFKKSDVERTILLYLGENSLNGVSCNTEDIYNYFVSKNITTSYGAIRGTTLRIRHKLLKYKENHPEMAHYIVLPEQLPHQGYKIQFKRNPAYSMEKIPAQDPWLNQNWSLLQEQGIGGFWKGVSILDGDHSPLTIYTLILSLNEGEGGKVICTIFSPSKHSKRIGFLEGVLKGPVFSLSGKWYTQYHKRMALVEEYKIWVDIWPFRRHSSEDVGITGRFTLHHIKENNFQHGQLEISQASIGSDEFTKIIHNFANSHIWPEEIV